MNENHICPICGGELVSEALMSEKKDACYYKVKSRYKVWPSAYACVPEETSKALTRSGWKTVNELIVGDEIMTFNMEKDILEFSPIINLHRYKKAQTTVVKSGNTGFMFECTPNHKWVVKFPTQKSDRSTKYIKTNDMSLIETSDMLDVKNNKHLVVSATYDGGNSLKKDKIFKYGDSWVKYILDITSEQRQTWLFSAIVYDGNQIKTQRILEKDDDISDLEWKYSGNGGKQSFGFKQKDIEHRDAFLLAAFLNNGTVTWKETKVKNIYSCYYVSNKRYKNVSNFKSVRNNITDVWCPETNNNTWVMMQETEGNGIITITGNSGALVKCRKKGAKNWGTKSEGFEEVDEACWKGYHKEGNKKMFGKTYPNCVKNKKEEQIMKEDQLRKLIRETIQELYNEQENYLDAMSRELHAAKKAKDVEKTVYYTQALTPPYPSAVASWDSFKGSWAYDQWLKKEKTKKDIEAQKAEFKRFAYLGEDMEDVVEESDMEEVYRETNWDMVPEGEEHTCEGDEFYEIYGDINADAKENLEEAEYRGRKVPLGKPMRGDVKKFKVFVRNPTTGKVKKVNFGDKKMRIKKSNPKRRKSFRARHNCANPGPRTKARYWSCRKW